MTPRAADPPRRLFLLDGHSLSYRAFFALPPSLATTSGQVTNAVYGFTSMLIKLLAEERPDLIAVAFDVGRPTVRLDKYAEYKAGRPETPDEFRQQLGLIVEVLETLRIPVIGIEGHEADDAIATLALRALAQGIEVVIVTADRDFFQLVRPGLTVMFNVKGISDIRRYDVEAVTERFGLPPEKYLDYVALKGDASDNIPGVPGVGEKTATKLVQDFGSVEELMTRTDELKGKLKESISAAGEQLALNKELAELNTDVDVDLEPEDAVMGEWDLEAVRRLFTSLEFRTLFERLEEVGRSAKPAVEVAELDLRRVDVAEAVELVAADGPKALRLDLEGREVRGIAVSMGGGQAAYAEAGDLGAFAEALADDAVATWLHDAKDFETAVVAEGRSLAGVRTDTMLSAYLLDPAGSSFELQPLSEQYLGTDVLGSVADEVEGQLFGDAWRRTAAEAAAVALLAPVLDERIDKAGLRRLLDEVELPLSSVLARMQANGVALDVAVPRRDGRGRPGHDGDVAGADLRARGGGVQPELAAPAAGDPVRQAEAVAGEEDPEGSALHRRERPGEAPRRPPDRRRDPVLARARQAELDVPGRAAQTGRSSRRARAHDVQPDGRGDRAAVLDQPEPAEHPGPRRARPPDPSGVRPGFEGRRPARRRLLADRAPDPGASVRRRGAQGGVRVRRRHPHGDVRPRVRPARGPGRPRDAEPGQGDQLRPRVRDERLGLASRLEITPDEAQEFIDAYFASFPQIRDFLDRQVARAAAEGFTETLLGRRRYIPELQAANPRVRDMGRRMALNAPIQGSAADVFKLGMIRVDGALRDSDLEIRMLLTVHDELVFEVSQERVEEAAGLVKREMEAAYELDVPLRADIGWGPNWAEAVPAGH